MIREQAVIVQLGKAGAVPVGEKGTLGAFDALRLVLDVSDTGDFTQPPGPGGWEGQ